jgi:hypothetical protein
MLKEKNIYPLAVKVEFSRLWPRESRKDKMSNEKNWRTME